MKKTLQLRNNKIMVIDFKMNMRENCPDGWEPLTLNKLVMITEITVKTGKREIKDFLNGDYIDLHDISFYTDEGNAVFYNKAIALQAQRDPNIAYVLKVGNSYVMLTKNECNEFTTALEEVKNAESIEKGFYDHIKVTMIKDTNKKLAEVKNEVCKIKKYMLNRDLLNDSEIKVARENYRNLMFEGGEGEYPYCPSKETYEYKCKQLNDLEYKLQQYQQGILFHIEVKL